MAGDTDLPTETSADLRRSVEAHCLRADAALREQANDLTDPIGRTRVAAVSARLSEIARLLSSNTNQEPHR